MVSGCQDWKNSVLKKVYFYVLMYEDQTQNYDQEIHEEYLVHNTPCGPEVFVRLASR